MQVYAQQLEPAGACNCVLGLFPRPCSVIPVPEHLVQRIALERGCAQLYAVVVAPPPQPALCQPQGVDIFCHHFVWLMLQLVVCWLCIRLVGAQFWGHPGVLALLLCCWCAGGFGDAYRNLSGAC